MLHCYANVTLTMLLYKLAKSEYTSYRRIAIYLLHFYRSVVFFTVGHLQKVIPSFKPTLDYLLYVNEITKHSTRLVLDLTIQEFLTVFR